MKNSPEIKLHFFSSYLGQKIMSCVHYNVEKLYRLSMARLLMLETKIDDGYYLSLKPLSKISDEDCLEIYNLITPNGKADNKILSGKAYVSGYDKEEIERAHTTYEAVLIIDFLRSKGYALPYMGVTVEEQIEWGWIKLKKG